MFGVGGQLKNNSFRKSKSQLSAAVIIKQSINDDTRNQPKLFGYPNALKERPNSPPSVNLTLCDFYLAHRALVSVMCSRDLTKRHKHIYALSCGF